MSQDRNRQIAGALGKAADREERRRLVAEYAQAYGVAEATVYRWARAGGWRSGRGKRADAGDRRCGLTDAQLDIVAGLVHRSQRADGRIPGTIVSVVETLQASGQLPQDVSPSTVARLLRERKQSRAEMQAPATWMSRRCAVGEVMMLDSSPALLWRLDESRGFRPRPLKELWDLERKPEAARRLRRHLIRYFLVEKASGMHYGEYAYTAGEAPLETIEVLIGGFALMGVPRMVVLDRGPGNVAWETRMLLWLLGVEVAYKGGSKNTMGAVESIHDRVQKNLEWRWRMAPPRHLVGANEHMAAWWVRDTREAIVRRSGRTRWAMFNALMQGVVRACPAPELLRQCIHRRPEERTINGEGLFQFGGEEFLVAGRRVRNQRLWVAHDPWRMPHAVVLRGFDPETFECDERIPARRITRDLLGFYQQMPEWGLGDTHPVGTRRPEHAEALSRAGKAATAAIRSGEIDWFASLGPIHQTEEAQEVRRLVGQRAGELELAEIERSLSAADAVYQAYLEIGRRHGREPNDAELAILKAWDEAGEPVPRADFEALVSGGQGRAQEARA